MNAPVAIIDNFVQLLIVIAVSGIVLIALVVPVVAIYFHHRKRQLWHETARLALEKGQPVPPVPEEDHDLVPPAGLSVAEWQAVRRAESRSQQVKGALVLLALGLGAIAFFSALGAKGFAMVGLIPGFIGLALLLHVSLQPGSRSSKNPPRNS